MKQLFLILIACLLGIQYVVAQNECCVSGKVETIDGETLPGAHVKLIDIKRDNRMAGASTDVDGCFSIPIAKGLYKLEISFVGYVTYVSNVEVKGDVHLPTIVLGEDSKQMEEVVVTARTVTYHPNGYVAEISKNSFYRNQDMSTILRMTPGTRVTHQGIEAYGQGVTKVYLNGRELHLDGQQLISFLQTIEGKNVKQMEVVASSGVEEDAASVSRSILKITTINPETGGMLSVGGNGHYRSFSSVYGGNVNLQWRINKKWGMYAYLSRMNSGHTDGTHDEIHFYETGEKRFSESEGKTNNTTYRTTFGVTYDWNVNNLFSIEGVAGSMANNTEQWEDTRRVNGQATEHLARGLSVGEDDMDYLNLSFLYLHKFGKNGELTFKAETYMRKDEDEEGRVYDYVMDEKQEIYRLNDEDNRIYTLKSDYTHQFPSVKGKLVAGVKAQWLENDNHNDNLYKINGEKDEYGSYIDDYFYKERILAAYGKYSFAYRDLNINAGLRMEHSMLSPQSVHNPERNVVNNYTDVFPELGLSYIINKKKGHNTSISFQKGIVRPSIGGLNPKVVRQSEYNYYMGNPSLTPYYKNNLSWTTHLAHQYIIRLSYSCSNGNYLSWGENKDGVIYTTTYNGGKSSSWEVYTSIPVKLGKNVQLTFIGSYNHDYTSFGKDERTYDDWSVGFSGMFKLPAGLQLMADFNYSPPSKSLYGKTYWYPLANLILTKSFMKGKLNTTLMAGDIFNHTSNNHRKFYYDTYYHETKGTKRGVGLTLNVRYNIRWGQKSNVRQAGTSGDSGRF